MCVPVLKYLRVILIVFCGFLLPAHVWAGSPAPSPGGQQIPGPGIAINPGQAHMEDVDKQGDIDVYVKGPNGAPLDGSAVLTLTKMSGEFVDQKTAQKGYARFNGIRASEYRIQVLAPRYEATTKPLEVQERALVKLTIELTPLSAEDAAASAGFYSLAPRVQKDVGRALVALRANKPNDALHPLEAAQKTAPNNAEIEYLFGLYSSQLKIDAQARTYWLKTLELNPRHLGALLSVGNDSIQRKEPAEAVPYLKRAVEVEPASWRAHLLLAEALLLEKQPDEAVKESQRAIEVGHERAATAQLVLAHALAERGDRDQAIPALEAYLKAHPSDADAAKDLETLKNPSASTLSVSGDTARELNSAAADAAALPVASNWRPEDIDDHIPPVEAGASCAVDDVVSKAGQQLMTLIKDVDRFAATESLVHESIGKSGLPSLPEKRKFDYVVSIQEVQHGYLNVEEYRNGHGGASSDFPDGVATNGLPALVLIFHPYNAVNFEMTCEGLARWNGGLAWQVHFKQRTDKPNTIKRYRIGADGPSYAVALKGRAWISADNYQIVRLETDLVAPVPQIRLVADHADIEYGPVKFAKANVNMWLPQSAEVYYDWKGKRIHRRHSFSEYMLFGVDDKQKITVPKVDEAPADTAASQAPKEKP
jgi:tetratricopeptide (TPR) repeat protein